MSTIKSSDEHLTLNADGASKDIKLQSNASEKVIVKSTGNVGINNSAPTQRLEINGNSQVNAYDGTSGSGGYSTSGLQIGNAFDAGLSGGNDDRNSIVWNERGLDMLFGTSNTERMRIDYNGNVGIGVADPDSTLEVSNNTSTYTTHIASTKNATGDNALAITTYDENASNTSYLIRCTTNTNVAGAGNDKFAVMSSGRVVSQSNAHSWVNYSQTNTPLVVRDSYNVSSVTDKGTGYAWVNFSTHHANTSYAVCGMAGNHKRVTQDGAGLNADFVPIYTSQAGQTSTTDEDRVFIITFGDSA